jgi:hypothetical protein
MSLSGLRYTGGGPWAAGEAAGRGVLAGWRAGAALDDAVDLGLAVAAGVDVRLAVTPEWLAAALGT